MYPEIRKYVEINLSISKFEHSLSTALICVELCSLFGLDENKGRIAGIAHDISRENPITNKIISLLNDGYVVTEEEKSNPVLLHGRIGAELLKNKLLPLPTDT